VTRVVENIQTMVLGF